MVFLQKILSFQILPSPLEALGFLQCLETILSNFSIYYRESSFKFNKTLRRGMLWGQLSFSQFSSVTHSYPTLCDPTDCSTPGLPVHHQLPEFTQTHVHWVRDAIQPSHPLSTPSPPALNLSQPEGLFQWVFTSGGQSTGVSASASVLPMNTQDWSPLGWTAWISLQSKGLSRVFSNTTVQKHQFFSTQLSLQSKSHIHTVVEV